MGAEGEPTPPSDGGHVGAEGEPTCHGGGGRGGDVGAVGEPTPPAGETSGVRGSGGDDGGVLSAPSSWTRALSPGEECLSRFLALLSLGEIAGLHLAVAAASGVAAAVAAGTVTGGHAPIWAYVPTTAAAACSWCCWREALPGVAVGRAGSRVWSRDCNQSFFFSRRFWLGVLLLLRGSISS